MVQRSLVLLTHLPFPRLFTDALLICKPLFLRYGVDMFESACHNISNWLVFHNLSTISSCFKLGRRQHVIRPWSWDYWARYCMQNYLEALMNSRWLKRRHLERPMTLSFMWVVQAVHILALTRLQLLASLPPADPPAISLFAALLPSLWSLWECLILSEPILVYSPSPALTSAAVWWLRDLSRPVRYEIYGPLTPSVRHRYHSRAIFDLTSPCTTPRNKH